MKFSIHPANSLPVDLAEELTQRLSHSQVLLLLPVGSALPSIKDLLSGLAQLPTTSLKNLTITVIDEKYAEDPDHVESHFYILSRLDEFKALLDKGAQTYKILAKGDSLSVAGKKFDQFITKMLHNGTYTLGCLGVANDYHIAGILPHKEEYFQRFKRNYVTAYDIDDVSMVDNPSRFRITLNFNGIMQLSEAVLFAIGPSKWRVLKNLVAIQSPTMKDIARNPVFCLHENKKKVRIYTDQDIF